jgi:hypothetical protein
MSTAGTVDPLYLWVPHPRIQANLDKNIQEKTTPVLNRGRILFLVIIHKQYNAVIIYKAVTLYRYYT